MLHNSPDALIKDISALIDEARNHIAHEYNSTQALLCWFIGKRIDEEILKSQRAEYGETIKEPESVIRLQLDELKQTDEMTSDLNGTKLRSFS